MDSYTAPRLSYTDENKLTVTVCVPPKDLACQHTVFVKEVRHIEMPKAAPKSPFVIFKKTRDNIEMK